MDIQWEDPPEEVLARVQGGGGRYLDFALALRQNKDRWARLPGTFQSEKSAQSTAANIRRGKMRGFEGKEYQAVHKDTTIWVRYVGSEKHESAAPAPAEGVDLDAAPKTPGLAPKIREWARTKGIEVPDRGRLPREIIDQYFTESGEEPPPHLRAVR